MDKTTVYQDDKKEWRWKRQSENGEILSISSESYKHKQHAVDQARELNPGTILEVKK